MVLVIKNGFIIDGSGINESFKADLLVEEKRIKKIGRSLRVSGAEKIIEAKGLIVAPGFIDIHTHSGFTLLVNPRAESKVRQGVTTEVVGNCGGSPFPLLGDAQKQIKKQIKTLYNLDVNWSSVSDYKKLIIKRGIAVNIALLVGHGTVRASVIGYGDRPPESSELREMKDLVRRCMDEGAFGLSSGLIYPPGCYSRTYELIELCKVVADYNGLYATHIRNEGDDQAVALREAIEIGEKAGVSVEISHMKTAGKRNWGNVVEALQMIDQARKRGIEVSFDFYPYLAGSTGLSALLPPWVHRGGVEKLVERLGKSKVRQRIREDLQKGVSGWWNPASLVSWNDILITSCTVNRDFEGKTISYIANLRGEESLETVFNLLIEEDGIVGMVIFMMSEEDLQLAMKYFHSTVGSDSSAIAPYGFLGRGKPHPRGYGCFPRVLGRYVREKGILSMEEAIRKMTYLPAMKLGLKDRGQIREGTYADLTIFNPEKIADTATYLNPHNYPDGVEYVIVNGSLTIEGGEHTGELAGVILNGPSVKGSA